MMHCAGHTELCRDFFVVLLLRLERPTFTKLLDCEEMVVRQSLDYSYGTSSSTTKHFPGLAIFLVEAHVIIALDLLGYFGIKLRHVDGGLRRVRWRWRAQSRPTGMPMSKEPPEIEAGMRLVFDLFSCGIAVLAVM